MYKKKRELIHCLEMVGEAINRIIRSRKPPVTAITILLASWWPMMLCEAYRLYTCIQNMKS